MNHEYGVSWLEFTGKDERLTEKQKFFKTEKARAKFVEKLEQKDKFYQIQAYTI